LTKCCLNSNSPKQSGGGSKRNIAFGQDIVVGNDGSGVTSNSPKQSRGGSKRNIAFGPHLKKVKLKVKGH
jgi:hypothetical protein